MLFTDVLYIWKAENSMIDVYIKAKRAIERRPFLARFLTSLEGLRREIERERPACFSYHSYHASKRQI